MPDVPIKRRNPVETRQKIIAAAQQVFAQQGYARTGLRDIASLADVSSALPVRYFGTKAGLFRAALENAVELDFITDGNKAEFGKLLVQEILDKQRPITIPAMITLSIGDQEAATIAAEFARTQLIEPMAKWLGAPRARARATAILMLSTAFVIFNRHIILQDSHPKRSSVSLWLANTAQAIVDGDQQTLKHFLQARPGV